MIEEIIENNESNREIVLKYDKEKYSIEYARSQKKIILKRLLDNQILEIFNDNIGFIVQCNKFDQTNFLVSEYAKDKLSCKERPMLKHYIDDPYFDSLRLKDELRCGSIFLDAIQITDSSFLIEDFGLLYIYNLKQKSKQFAKIYNNPKINEFFDKNVLLVRERIGFRYDLIDYLTYGINPEVFTIVTPIWSEFQQRIIDLYTKEQAEELRKKMLEKGIYLRLQDLGEITIYFEVEKYMQELTGIFPLSDVYIDGYQVNEEFVRKFVKK